MKHLRLYRGGIAVLFMLTCAGFAAAFALLVVAHLCGLLSINNWHELAWASAGLIVAIVMVGFLCRRSVSLMASNGRGLRAYNHGQYADAEAHFRRSWQMAQSLPADDPCRGDVLGYLVQAARAQGNYDDAESFGQLHVTAQEQAWGKGHEYTVLAIEGLADIYLTLARYSAAHKLFEQALATRNARLDRNSLELARTLQRMGQLHLEQDRARLAEPFLQQAFVIVKQRGADTAEANLTIIRQLALSLVESDKAAHAATLVDGYLQSVQQMHAADSWPVANGLLNVALVRSSLGDCPEAEKLVRRALAIAEKTCGRNRPALKDFYRMLGVILQAQDKLGEAEECYRQALNLCEEYLAPIHPELASVLEQYADLLMLMGRTREAENFAQRARQIRDFHTPIGL